MNIAELLSICTEYRKRLSEAEERERIAIASWDEERLRAIREGRRVELAEKELAVLREDKARLDWLEQRKSNTTGNCDLTAKGYWTVHVNDGTDYYNGGNQLNLRQSIDAALKENTQK